MAYDVADDGWTNTASFLGPTFPASEPLSRCKVGADHFLVMNTFGTVEVWAYIAGVRTVYTPAITPVNHDIVVRTDGTDVWLVYWTEPTVPNPWDPTHVQTLTALTPTVDVWNGGGFTNLGVDPAYIANDGTDGGQDIGFVGNLTACACSAEPGALHVMWSEGGPEKIPGRGIGGQDCDQRVSYSKWSNAGLVTQVDALLVNNPAIYTSPFTGPVATRRLFITNASGTPIAFYGVPSTTDTTGVPSIGYTDNLEMWDMTTVTTNAPVVLQTAVGSTFNPLIDSLGGGSTTFIGGTRLPDASGLLYVLVPFAESGSTIMLLLAVPKDGSGPFTFPDGNPVEGDGVSSSFNDVTDEGDNIWVGAGAILQYHRTCPAWELWQAFPVATIVGSIEMEIVGDTIYTIGRLDGSSGLGDFGPLSLPILRGFRSCGGVFGRINWR